MTDIFCYHVVLLRQLRPALKGIALFFGKRVYGLLVRPAIVHENSRLIGENFIAQIQFTVGIRHLLQIRGDLPKILLVVVVELFPCGLPVVPLLDDNLLHGIQFKHLAFKSTVPVYLHARLKEHAGIGVIFFVLLQFGIAGELGALSCRVPSS